MRGPVIRAVASSWAGASANAFSHEATKVNARLRHTAMNANVDGQAQRRRQRMSMLDIWLLRSPCTMSDLPGGPHVTEELELEDRVAEAIWKANMENTALHAFPYGQLIKPTKDDLRRLARAALAVSPPSGREAEWTKYRLKMEHALHVAESRVAELEAVARDLYEALGLIAECCVDRELPRADIWDRVEAAQGRFAALTGEGED